MPDNYDISHTAVPMGAGDPAHYFFTADGVQHARCYAYAINHTLTVSMNPGSLSPARCCSAPIEIATGDAQPQVFRDAAAGDGLIYHGPGMPAPRARHYIVALFITDRTAGGMADYHWVRQDSAGNWSHKQHWAIPTNMDYADPPALIMQPHTANMVRHAPDGRLLANYRFVAYYFVPTAGLTNRSNRRWCFIATATCATLGLPEDCDDLMLLRWFRDSVMLQTEDGRRAVARYYEIAPRAVASIAASPHADAIFRDFHARIVAPAVGAIRIGDFPRAEALFYQALRWLPRLL